MQTNDTMAGIASVTIVDPKIVTNSVTTTDNSATNTVCAPDANNILVCN